MLRDLAHGNAAPRPLPLTPGQLTLRVPCTLIIQWIWEWPGFNATLLRLFPVAMSFAHV